MKILVIDPILFLAPCLVQRLVLDGHEVVYAPIWGPKSDSPFVDLLCHGLGAKVDPEGWMNWLDWADVATVSGSEHRGHIVKFLRQHGVPVCGPGPWGVRLELDRAQGHEFFREAGMDPSVSTPFTDPDDALKFLAKKPGAYILKLDQTARALSETFVGRDSEGRDVIHRLQDLAPDLRYLGGRVKLYLEEPLPGVEVGIGGWFNGSKFLGDLMTTYETDGGYAYDLRTAPSDWIDKGKLESALAAHKFHGSFDMNGFLGPDGWRPIEWTPRWGAGTTEMFCHSAADLGELLYAAATGGECVPLDKSVQGKIVALVNARDDDSDLLSPTPIVLGEGVELPHKDGPRSFWARWPGKTPDGWLNLLPLGSASEKRGGMYVGVGSSFEVALKEAQAVTKDVKIVGSHAETGRVREEIGKQMAQVDAILRGKTPAEESVSRLVREVRHMLPKAPRR